MTSFKVKDLLPVPKLEDAKRILCIQPHTDDNEVGAGASIAKLIAAGVKVGYLTVTDGGVGTVDRNLEPERLILTRRKELEESGRLLGVKDFFCLDHPDGGTLQLSKVRDDIVKTIRIFRPDTVMAPDPWLQYEAHSDHLVTGLAAAESLLYCEFPNYCPEHLSKEGLEPHKVQSIAFYGTSRPNTFIDVENTWQLKLEALKKHQSQFDAQAFEFLGLYLTAKARELAENTDFEIVEAFKVLTPMHLHYFEFTESC